MKLTVSNEMLPKCATTTTLFPGHSFHPKVSPSEIQNFPGSYIEYLSKILMTHESVDQPTIVCRGINPPILVTTPHSWVPNHL